MHGAKRRTVKQQFWYVLRKFSVTKKNLGDVPSIYIYIFFLLRGRVPRSPPATPMAPGNGRSEHVATFHLTVTNDIKPVTEAQILTICHR